MTVANKSAFTMIGKVESVLVGSDTESLVTRPVKKLQVVTGHGIKGDVHAGARLADAREKTLLKFGIAKGTEIANYREFSAVSIEELDQISKELGLPNIMPGYLGANLLISGIPRMTQLPPGTLLFFQKSAGEHRSAVLAVWKENYPCQGPATELQRHYPDVPNVEANFVKTATGKRGIVGSVYASGFIAAGDEVVVQVPKQRLYEALTTARGQWS